MLSYNNYINESKLPKIDIFEGDRVIVTKKGKYHNQTGVVTYVEYEEDRGLMVYDITVKFDYTGKETHLPFYDVEKLDPIINITKEDPYGEEDWRENTYESYKLNGNQIKLDGKHGFFMFLKLIDDLKINFIKTNYYLNVGKYQYFFTTEHIRNKDNLIGYFRDSLSLKTTCETVKNLKDKRVSFYFGVKNNNLEYGFEDDMTREIYKTGLFKIDTRYLRSLKSYKCLVLIEGILKVSNIGNLNLLQEIKSALKYWYEGKGDVLILNENIVKRSIDKEDLKEELNDVNGLLRKYENWCEKFKWINRVFYYIDSEDDDKVTFYIKIKPKQDKDLGI